MILTKVKNEVGATAIEYGLIASLISVLAVSGMSAVGVNLSNTYCTISKHLGGSGTCSGGGSSVTGSGGIPAGSGSGSSENNSGDGGMTGSPGLDSQTGPAYLNALESSLKDNFDPTYLDKSLGGSNVYKEYGLTSAKNYLSAMNNYNKTHSNDQITHVFGLYDSLTKQPITSFAKASQGLNDDNDNIFIGENGNYGKKGQDNLEVTTQQGHVYTVNDLGDPISEKSEQLQKGS